MTVSYEHIRLAPVGELAKELVKGTLEGDMAEGDDPATVSEGSE